MATHSNAALKTRLSQVSQPHAEPKQAIRQKRALPEAGQKKKQMKLLTIDEDKTIDEKKTISVEGEEGYSSQEDMKTSPNKPAILEETPLASPTASQTPHCNPTASPTASQGGLPRHPGLPTPPYVYFAVVPVLGPQMYPVPMFQPWHTQVQAQCAAYSGFTPATMDYPKDCTIMRMPPPPPTAIVPPPPMQSNQSWQEQHGVNYRAPPPPRHFAPSSKMPNNHRKKPALHSDVAPAPRKWAAPSTSKTSSMPRDECKTPAVCFTREDVDGFRGMIRAQSEAQQECVLCHVLFNSKVMEQSHLQGKRHELAVQKSMVAASAAKAQVMTADEAIGWEIDRVMRLYHAYVGRMLQSPMTGCCLCDVHFPTDAQRKSHLEGKFHLENLRLVNQGRPPRKHKSKDRYHTRFDMLDPRIQNNVEKGLRDNAKNRKRSDFRNGN